MKRSRIAVGVALGFLSTALALGTICLQDTKPKCCEVIAFGPGCVTPCGGTVTCCDVKISNPDIDLVRSGFSSGYKDTVSTLPDQTCKWQSYHCQGSSCVQGSIQQVNCHPSKLVAPMNPCTK